MIEFLIIGGAVFVLLLLTAAVVLSILLAEYLRFRRSVWIAVSPVMVPVVREQIPPVLEVVLDRAEPVLEALGFRRVVMAHAPSFRSDATWFHVLLVNRSTGERAGVMCYGVAGETPFVNLTLAAEFTDGELVVTEWRELFADPGVNLEVKVDAVASQAQRLYELHRSKLEKLANRGASTTVLPTDDEVLSWLQGKAAAVTAEFAKNDFEPNASGDYYVPTRRHALRLVGRNFSVTPRRRTRPSAPGFPVVLPAEGGK